MKEATARIKINELLKAAGWRFFPDGSAPADICLEPSVTIKSSELDAFGDDFEKTGKGFIDFLLLDSKGFPLIILEAKSEDKSPLVGKEQARKWVRFGGKPLLRASRAHGVTLSGVEGRQTQWRNGFVSCIFISG